jgi:hypothetical protein
MKAEVGEELLDFARPTSRTGGGRSTMSVDTVFTLCNASVIPAWALLVFAPGWIWTRRLVHSMLYPLALGAVYLAGFAMVVPGPEGGGFGTLRGVMTFFTVPTLVLVGWVHYLVFDLFVGSWQVRDARRRGIRHLYVVPSLLLTFLAGPIGLALYLVLRWQLTDATTLEEQAAA